VTDTVNKEGFISSFLTSGYHRTTSENADRNNLTQTAFGGNIIYRSNKWHVGVNGIYYYFSLPVQKRMNHITYMPSVVKTGIISVLITATRIKIFIYSGKQQQIKTSTRHSLMD